MALLTTKQMAIWIAIIIALAKFIIMLLLRIFPFEAGSYSEAVLDTALLAVLSTSAIYIWVIKPFADSRDEALA